MVPSRRPYPWPFREFTRFIWRMQTYRQVVADSQTKQFCNFPFKVPPPQVGKVNVFTGVCVFSLSLTVNRTTQTVIGAFSWNLANGSIMHQRRVDEARQVKTRLGLGLAHLLIAGNNIVAEACTPELTMGQWVTGHGSNGQQIWMDHAGTCDPLTCHQLTDN